MSSNDIQAQVSDCDLKDMPPLCSSDSDSDRMNAKSRSRRTHDLRVITDLNAMRSSIQDTNMGFDIDDNVTMSVPYI